MDTNPEGINNNGSLQMMLMPTQFCRSSEELLSSQILLDLHVFPFIPAVKEELHPFSMVKVSMVTHVLSSKYDGHAHGRSEKFHVVFQ